MARLSNKRLLEIAFGGSLADEIEMCELARELCSARDTLRDIATRGPIDSIAEGRAMRDAARKEIHKSEDT